MKKSDVLYVILLAIGWLCWVLTVYVIAHFAIKYW